MSDSIKKDDEKFNDLITKQHHSFESFAESVQRPKDKIETDDEKMERLMDLQEGSDKNPDGNLSLEEKYENELMIQQVIKILDESSEQEDPFAKFFKDDDEEFFVDDEEDGA